MIRIPAVLFAAFLLNSCASATAVNMAEPRRVVGTESAVRIDAEITEEMRIGAPVAINYAITNQRATAIAIADILPESSWDGETRTVTVSIGSEVPGETTLPRLIRIGPGEKKSFATAAHIARLIPARSADPRITNSTLLRLKVNFLGDTGPFTELIDIPQKAVIDPKRADELFAEWLARNETLYTNAVPVKITLTRPAGPEQDIERPATPTRRRRGGV